MSAVANVIPLRQLDQYERQALRRELSRWGAWQDKQMAHEGYPSADNIQRSIMGAGGGFGGHRVLILDMPDDVWKVNARVMRLPERLQAIIRAVHCNVMTDLGLLSTFENRCQRMGLSERTGRRLYTQALLAIAGIPFDSGSDF